MHVEVKNYDNTSNNFKKLFAILVKNDVNISDLNFNYIYFGQWTVKDRSGYREYINSIYLFDIYNKSEEKYLDSSDIKQEADRINLYYSPICYKGKHQELYCSIKRLVTELIKEIKYDLKKLFRIN